MVWCGVVWLGEEARKRGLLFMAGAIGAFLCVVAPSVAISTVVAAGYTKRDRALAISFLAAEWKIAKPRVMCARLRKRLARYPDLDVWFVGVL